MDTEETAVAMKICPQHPGVQAKAERGGDWTLHHGCSLDTAQLLWMDLLEGLVHVHVPKKSVLSQQLAQSLNFLFLLGAAEFQMLDLGGQLEVYLL